MSMGRKPLIIKKHFVLSPKQKFRQNFKQRTKTINAHSVYIPLMRSHAWAMCIYHGVGILFLHRSFC